MISSIASTSLVSGLAAQARAAETAASNIANVNSTDYKAARGQVVSTSPAGASYVPLPPEGEVNLASEVIGLQTAAQSYALTAKTFASMAQTEKDVLNVLA